MTNIPTFTLNDGNQIPAFGFGTFQIPADGSTKKAVTTALKLGYRHIDTATAYLNEQEVGQAIAESGIPRDQIWVTSKLWLQDYGFEAATKGIDTSLRKLGLDYVDLYLLHQPYGDVPGAWDALVAAQKAGKIRSIGMSNMSPKYWQKFIPDFAVRPAVNQVEFNPYFQQQPLRQLMAETNTMLEAWAPLGQGDPHLFSEPAITKLATKYNKDAGQIILRFDYQMDAIIFLKSVHENRIASNQHIFDFALTEAEMASLKALDKGHGRHDPDVPGIEERLLHAFDVHAND
jgi:2,5-diketo-D-gluconate reductase A